MGDLGTRAVALAVSTLAGAFVLAAACALGASGAGAQPAKRLLLVPLGDFPSSRAGRLERRLQQELGVNVSIGARLPLPPAALNQRRRQYIAEQVSADVARRLGSLTQQQDLVVLGLASADMYARSKTWNYAFTWRHTDRLGVISSARMDPQTYGLKPNEALLQRRLYKIVLRDVGFQVLLRPTVGDRRSVLYPSILSVDDLDRMEPLLAPKPYSAAERGWIAESGRACAAYRSALRRLPGSGKVDTPGKFVELLRQVLPVQRKLGTALRQARSAPADRQLVRELLASFGRMQRQDEAALADLSRSWSEQRFRRWLADNLSVLHALRAAALELGSTKCAAVFVA